MPEGEARHEARTALCTCGRAFKLPALPRASDQPVLGHHRTTQPRMQRKGNVPLQETVFEQCQRELHQSGTFLAGSEESNAVKPPSEAITARINLDLVKGNSVFPRCCVATAWVVLNQCSKPKVYTFITIKLSKWQWVLSDKRFNSLQHIVNFLFLLQGFFWFGFVFPLQVSGSCFCASCFQCFC